MHCAPQSLPVSRLAVCAAIFFVRSSVSSPDPPPCMCRLGSEANN
jgi:hypothetical protein